MIKESVIVCWGSGFDNEVLQGKQYRYPRYRLIRGVRWEKMLTLHLPVLRSAVVQFNKRKI